MTGKTIGNYRILETLGEGGMGIVYLAEDEDLERRVALKVLPKEFVADRDRIDRFQREAKSVARLNHPNIVTIYSVEHDSGEHFFTMELVEGTPLDDFIPEGGLTVRSFFDIALPLTAAIAAAHDGGVIHRDLKPANVMIAANGTVKVLDFGLAKAASQGRNSAGEASTAMMTAVGTVLGTAGYMSPEQAEGKAVDERSDLFSLGVVLYEMAAGRRPFVGDTPLAIMSSILRDPPPPLLERRSDLPSHLGRIVVRCLEKEPDDRYQSARELHDELQRLNREVDGGPVSPLVARATPQRSIPTPFIGRRRELAALTEILKTDDVRLVTLTGPGGIGKTRLALQAAADLADEFEHGCRLIDLAPIGDPERVPAAIADAFDLAEVDGESMLETLQKHLLEQRVLLVLDNFEQIVDAAPVVGDLLTSARRLKVLVTSRELLRLSGEHNFSVPPLSLPKLQHGESATEVAGYEAVTLFTQRATAVRPDFELHNDNALEVAEICVRLDGLPLAIELAAARVAVFSTKQLLGRLESRLNTVSSRQRDLPDRQRTLRGTIDWSYDLLDENEKTLLARLAVFQGGRTLDAAEAVCAGRTGHGTSSLPPLEIDVAEGLESLVHKSLLRRSYGSSGEPRFEMLETIHEYGRERLEASGESEALHRAHVEYFAHLAEEAEPHVNTTAFAEWKPRLEDDGENILSALAWSLASDDIEFGIRLLIAITSYWYPAGRYALFREWVDRALERADDVPPALRAGFLIVAGHSAFFQHDRERGGFFLRQAVEAALATGNKKLILRAYLFLMTSAMGVNDPEVYEESKEWFSTVVAISDELQDKSGKAQAYNNMGEIARSNDDYSTAKTRYEQSLQLYREEGNALRESLVLGNLGQVSEHEERYEEAIDYARQALTLALEIDNLWLISDVLRAVAPSFGLSGQPEKAARLYGANETISESIGSRIQPGDLAQHRRGLAAVKGLMDSDAFDRLWAEGRELSADEAAAFVFSDES